MDSIIQNVYGLFKSDGGSGSNLLSLADNELLKVINELNTIFKGDFDIELPEIVIVGSQSSGKSTTINRLIDMSILPTGKHIVTRTPTNIRLINWSKNSCKVEFYEFVNSSDKTLKVFTLDPKSPEESTIRQIQKYIVFLTDKYAGKQKNVVDEPIRMNIHSPNVPNLVITDLPGLTTMSLKDQGQPDDISKQIKTMISKYIKREKCIIMSTIPSNIELETDLGLKLVKKYDPDGVRTLGVLTKPDLAGKECNLGNYVDGILDSNLKLKYGYYVVKNTPADEIDENSDARTIEQNYFSTEKTLKSVANKDRLGIGNLGSSLSEILISSIRAILPKLIEKIRDVENSIDSQLECLGYDFPKDEKGKRVMINLLISQFQKLFTSSIKDRGATYNTGTQLTKTYTQFKNNIRALNPFNSDRLSDTMINEIVANYEGIHMPSPTTPVGVLELCFTGIKRSGTDVKNKDYSELEPIYIMKEPFAECMRRVQAALLGLADTILTEDRFSRFPNLVVRIRSVLTDKIIQEKYERTTGLMNDILRSEKECIWADDSEFLEALRNNGSTTANGSIRAILDKYYGAIKRVMSHSLHKVIHTFFVCGIIDELNLSLLREVLLDTTEDLLLKENEEKAKKRDHLTAVKDKIVQAKKVIAQSKMIR